MVRKVLIAVLALAVVAPAAAQAGNGNGKAKPLEAAQAVPLIAAPGMTDGVAVAPVTKQEAAAAAAQSGAVTQAAPGFASPTAALAAANACFSWSSGWSWGTWPYSQHITDLTYYCAVYGSYITWRSTTVQASSPLCGVDWADSPIISGGIGFFWMTVQATASFSCPILGLVPYHKVDWLRTAYNAWGNASQVDAS